MFQLSLRIAAIRMTRKEVKEQMTLLQHHENKTDTNEKLYSLTGNSLRRIVNGFTVLAAGLILFVIVCLVTLVLLDEMTWTILTNNFALVLGTVTSNMILLRIQKIKTQVVVDEHKVLVYESALLLKESLKLAPDPTNAKVRVYSDEVQLYLRALKSTEQLKRPDHIEIDEKYTSGLHRTDSQNSRSSTTVSYNLVSTEESVTT